LKRGYLREKSAKYCICLCLDIAYIVGTNSRLDEYHLGIAVGLAHFLLVLSFLSFETEDTAVAMKVSYT